MKQVEGRSLSV